MTTQCKSLSSFVESVMKYSLAVLILIVGATRHGAHGVSWDTMLQGDCVLPGLRKYFAALIIDDNSKEDPATACGKLDAWVNDTYFPVPDHCRQVGLGMYGEFHYPDLSCRTQWGDLQDDGCVGETGLRQYSSVLWGIPYGKNWEYYCYHADALVLGYYLFKPFRCVSERINVWGQFRIPDECCISKPGCSVYHPKKRFLVPSSCCPRHDIEGDGDDSPPSDPTHGLDKFGDETSRKSFVYFINFIRKTFFNSRVYNWRSDVGPLPYVIEFFGFGSIAQYQVDVRDSRFSSPLMTMEATPVFPAASSLAVRTLQALELRPVSPQNLVKLDDKRTAYPRASKSTEGWIAIDIKNTKAQLIVMPPLKGSQLTVGWDNNSGILYLAQVQTNEQGPSYTRATTARLSLSREAMFHGVKVADTEIHHFPLNIASYANEDEGLQVSILGVIRRDDIRGNTIYLVVQYVDENRAVHSSRLLYFGMGEPLHNAPSPD